MRAEPITLKEAAAHFGRPWSSLRDWPSRYNARRLMTPRLLGRRTVFYDFADLSTIDAHLFRGDPVPATPELRDAYRAELRNAA